jgi:hypothetical protein
MKFSFMPPAFALALALGLSACGGKASFPVGVTVTGLAYPNLVLTTNGMDRAISPPEKKGDTVTATFPNSISYGDVYEVTVKSDKHQPAHQTCVPVGTTNKDTAGRLATINATFNCTINAKTISGNVLGLKSTDLVLTNGSDQFTVIRTDTTGAKPAPFTLPTAVPYSKTYGVTILHQPTDPTVQDCTVDKGTGTVADADITDIVVTCKDVPPKTS